MTSFRLPLRGTAIVLTMMAAFFLSACAANTSSTDEHGLLPHLTVDMRLPSELSLGSSGQFRIAISQDGKPVQADDVAFEFWPEGHPEQRVEIPGEFGGSGLYTAEYRLNSEGVYVVRCRVSSGSLEAMPAKRFAIGEEAVLRLAALEQQQTAGAPADGGSSGGHHH
ncbi:hypothetical protein PACILC2_45250 [Paenibacillus cisolokensis]|uniref:YtkA-like domain-containing protein n=1 Tax=Paenibacillus cisolokensis TaxID=1658519 RepID=A0ABQ4NCI8_9BACL|nr:FixH family protein [Paenibacillus cisolokensis]GIQ65957.1 hypothetical protein PACILC2_45250 [Paenibacillus cisolokensis]